MINKFLILVIIFVLLLTFYLVISLSAVKKNSTPSPNNKNYLFNVRILISFIALVSLILWFFL